MKNLQITLDIHLEKMQSVFVKVKKEGISMNEKRCVLCDRVYEYDKYKLFGRGCLSNLYELLSISNPPRGTKDKEMYYRRIFIYI